MKKLIAILVLAAACTSLFAQKVPDPTSYKNLKQVYAPNNYVKSSADPYSVFWMGAGSLFIPGMGQLIMKENGRGWAFLGSSVGLGLVGSFLYGGALSLARSNNNGTVTVPEANRGAATGLLVGAAIVGAAQLGASIWSCIDAVNIAKVKNQYYQDAQGKHAFSASVHPSVALVQSSNGTTVAPGMTFALKF